MTKWLHAKLNLVMALVWHFCFKRWFQNRGLKSFQNDYEGENLFPAVEHKSNFGNCIQCGFCVVTCEVKENDFYKIFLTPAQIAFSLSRSLPEISLNQDFLSYCQSCRACEKICPTGVPLTKISEFVKNYSRGSILDKA